MPPPTCLRLNSFFGTLVRSPEPPSAQPADKPGWHSICRRNNPARFSRSSLLRPTPSSLQRRAAAAASSFARRRRSTRARRRPSRHLCTALLAARSRGPASTAPSSARTAWSSLRRCCRRARDWRETETEHTLNRDCTLLQAHERGRRSRVEVARLSLSAEVGEWAASLDRAVCVGRSGGGRFGCSVQVRCHEAGRSRPLGEQGDVVRVEGAGGARHQDGREAGESSSMLSDTSHSLPTYRGTSRLAGHAHERKKPRPPHH